MDASEPDWHGEARWAAVPAGPTGTPPGHPNTAERERDRQPERDPEPGGDPEPARGAGAGGQDTGAGGQDSEAGGQDSEADRGVEADKDAGSDRDAEPAGPVGGGHRARTGRPGAAALAGLAVTILATAVAVYWIRVVARATGHGLDLTDEGFYLLSYRWWDVNHRTFTGMQYLYGPVFEALDYNIADLRMFRLVTVVATHLLFGWSFMRWLRLRRPAAPPSPFWETAGMAAIVAAGGVVYSWLPLTPGYNDLVLLGGLVAMAAVLRAAAHVDRGKWVPPWWPLLLGVVIVAVLLAKWSSVAMLALVLVTGLLVVAPGGFWRLLTFLLLTVAGAGAGVAWVHYRIVPLDVAVPQLREVNRLIAGTSYSPVELLEMYGSTALDLFNRSVAGYWPLLAAAAVVLLSRRVAVQIVTGALGATGLAVAVGHAVQKGRLDGGADNREIFPAVLLAVMLFTLVTILVSVLRDLFRRTDRSSLTTQKARSWIILVLLLLFPAAQAFGTGNQLYTIGINAFAAWLALLIAVFTGMDRAPFAARALNAGVVAAAVVVSASLAIGGVWWNPYRGVTLSGATATVSEIPALSSVNVEPRFAARYIVLYNRLRPYLQPEGRAIIAYDKLPGVVLFLGGKPVGEAWTNAKERGRTAAGIAATCPRGEAPWGRRLPILVLTRRVTDMDRAALEWCDLDVRRDYTLLAPPKETMSLQVFVPTRDLQRLRRRP